MHLLRAAGLIGNIEPEVENEEASDAMAKALLDEAEKFLRCGVSMAVYRDLGDLEKSALILASEKIMADLALRIAYALQGPEGAAAVAEPIDGGRGHDRVSLAAKVAAAAQTYKDARIPPVRT